MSTLLVLGTLDASWQQTIQDAAARASLAIVPAAELSEVSGGLDEVRAVVLGRLAGGSSSAAETLRQDDRFERVALFGLQDQPTLAEYVGALASGVDDVLCDSTNAPGAFLRLRGARDAGAGAPASLHRGLGWSLGPAGGASAARARALRRAGFRATTGIALGAASFSHEPRLSVVVWETTEPLEALRLVESARQTGALCRFVLCVPDAELTATGAACERLEGVRVLPVSAPADSVVFLINEMSETPVENQRTSRRRLASHIVRFRSPGRADVGLSYNVSAGGLYVRTVAPVASGRVELSVEMPAGRVIELGCEVAWSKPLSYDGTASVPPGFGVRILDASEAARAELALL